MSRSQCRRSPGWVIFRIQTISLPVIKRQKIFRKSSFQIELQSNKW